MMGLANKAIQQQEVKVEKEEKLEVIREYQDKLWIDNV